MALRTFDYGQKLKKMKYLIHLFSFAFLLLSLVPAQGQDEGKIVIEITKEIDGEKRTFKGQYNSTEEMQADPNYREFAGEDNQFQFWSNDSDVTAFLDIDQLQDMQTSVFKFFDSEEGGNSFFFHNLDDDETDGKSFNYQFDNFDSEEFSEEMREKLKDLGIEIQELVDRYKDRDESGPVVIIAKKSIKVSEVEDEFGKKGTVSKNNLLELSDLSFYPNPSIDGKISVRFTVPQEGDLSLKVSNLEGKEVFGRSFDNFFGLYRETIDLSGQSEGIYLLEIAQGKKRLTRKLVVE